MKINLLLSICVITLTLLAGCATLEDTTPQPIQANLELLSQCPKESWAVGLVQQDGPINILVHGTWQQLQVGMLVRPDTSIRVRLVTRAGLDSLTFYSPMSDVSGAGPWVSVDLVTGPVVVDRVIAAFAGDHCGFHALKDERGVFLVYEYAPNIQRSTPDEYRGS